MSPSSNSPSSTTQAESLELGVAESLRLSDAEVPAGLVPAAELPSAVDVLAQLFPPEDDNSQKAAGPASSKVATLPADPAANQLLLPRPAYDPYSLTSALESQPTASAAIDVARIEKESSRDLNSSAPGLVASGLDIQANQTSSAQENIPAADSPSAPADEAKKTHANDLSPDSRKEPEQRTTGSFSRIAGGLRNLFSGTRAKGKQDELDAPPVAETPGARVAPDTSVAPEAISPLAEAAHLAAVGSRAKPDSATGEILTAGTESAPKVLEVPAVEHASVEVNLTEEPVAGSNLAAPQELSNSEPQSPALGTWSLLHLPSEAGPALQPPKEAKSQELTSSPQEQSYPALSGPELGPSGPKQDLEPLSGEIAEEEPEDFDASDDDQAIAMAIERYANSNAAAQAELSASMAAPPVVFSSAADSPAEPAHSVDINAVLEIPRDPEPVRPGNVSAGTFSLQAPLASTLPASEPGLRSATQDLFHEDDPLTNLSPPAEAATDSSSHASGSSYRDWSFEEKLASHHEWIESKGAIGKRADLTSVDLEGSDLIGVDLRFVDLHDANLRAADLLMADLRDSCLVRANFRDSCLVGANLEAANLEGASLETAMGLVPRQLAGANLHEASLPQALQFEALGEFKRASLRVHRFFVALMSISALSALLIWMTKDFQLVTNSAVLFFLHSAAAAAALPTVQFYLAGPLALFVLYLVFQFHLQHLWDLTLELPAIFPDGRALGENEPRIVLGLLRAHFRWMNVDAPSTRFVEKALSIFLAYWIVPVALTLYWVRFLTLQELRGTVLQELLIVAATAVSLYSTAKVGRPAERWMLPENLSERLLANLRGINPVTPALVLLGVLTFLAAGTMMGVPHKKERAPQFMAGSIRRWAPAVLWSVGIDPFADLTEVAISKKPANWNGSDEQVASVTGVLLNSANLRYALAYRAFMANSHLLNADLQGAFLSQADLRGSDLGQSNLKYAILDQAQMNHVNLDRATLEGANLSRADLRAANLSYAAMANATLVDARLDGATLYGAKLPGTTLIRTDFEKADLRESHLEAANLDNVDMQGAYLWSAKLSGARLTNAQLAKAIFVNADLRGADLRWAHLDETVLTGADLAGTYLDGADLRGAVGFGANQICAAKSRRGLLLDGAMQALVTAQCGAGN